MSFQPASIRTLQQIKSVSTDEIYDILDKNEKPSFTPDEVSQAPPRTPSDLKFRSTGSKFLPNHIDAIMVENSKKTSKKEELQESDSESDDERRRK